MTSASFLTFFVRFSPAVVTDAEKEMEEVLARRGERLVVGEEVAAGAV